MWPRHGEGFKGRGSGFGTKGTVMGVRGMDREAVIISVVVLYLILLFIYIYDNKYATATVI